MSKKVRFIDDPILNLSDPIIDYLDNYTILVNFINNVIKLRTSRELLASGLCKILGRDLQRPVGYKIYNSKLAFDTIVPRYNVKAALAKFWHTYILCKHCRTNQIQSTYDKVYCLKCKHGYLV